MGWEVKKILQENTTADSLGTSVAIYGNYAIVGGDTGGTGSGGMAAIYQRMY